MARWVATTFVILAIAGASGAPPALASAALDPGEDFPTIELPSLDGKPMSVADYRGRKIALHVFASW